MDQPDSPKTVFQRQFSNTGMQKFCRKVLKKTDFFGQTKGCITATMTSKAKYYIFKLAVLPMYFSKVERNSEVSKLNSEFWLYLTRTLC